MYLIFTISQVIGTVSLPSKCVYICHLSSSCLPIRQLFRRDAHALTRIYERSNAHRSYHARTRSSALKRGLRVIRRFFPGASHNNRSRKQRKSEEKKKREQEKNI